MIIEGKNAVYEALSSNTTIEKLCIEKGNFAKDLNRIIALAREKGIKVSFEKSETLEKLSPSYPPALFLKKTLFHQTTSHIFNSHFSHP